MTARRQIQSWRWLALCTVFGTAVRGLPQQRPAAVEEPRLLRFNLNEVSAGVYSEGSFERAKYDGGSVTADSSRIFVGPLLGMNFNGSVYHPNLMTYQVISEGAFGWAGNYGSSGNTSYSQNDFNYLGAFNANANFLANKPYNANLFANYDHTYQDNDFFTTLIVDQWRYGGQVAYRHEDILSLSVSYVHRDEDTYGYSAATDSHSTDDTLALNARNDRQSGSTQLNYSYYNYGRVDSGIGTDGINNTVSLADSEKFGSQDQTTLNSRVSYSNNDFDNFPNDQLSTGAILTTEHREDLTSLYEVTYDRYTADTLKTDGFYGQGQLQHQMYDSLTSTLIAQGADFESSDRFSSGYNRNYGGGLNLAYNKNLSSTAQLRVDNSFLLQHVDQKNIGVVENERHSFVGGSTPNSFFLNQPFVDESTIMVWNVTRTRLYFRGIDYVVFRNGALTGIQRIVTSTIDPVVLVDYRAAPSPAGSYEALTDQFGVRVNLFDNLWGIYGRAQWFVNNAPQDMRVQDVISYLAGTEVTWRWLRAGAEYEIYNATYSDYRVARLFQGLTFGLDDASSLSLEASQSWTDYTDADRTQQEYRFIARYHRALTSSFWLNVDGGVDYLTDTDLASRTLAVFRPSIRYVVGRTTINAEYDFEYAGYETLQQTRRHLFRLSVKRVF